MNDSTKQQTVEKEFEALEAHIGKKVIISYVSASKPLSREKAILVAINRYKNVTFKKRSGKRVSSFIWETYGIQKIATPEGVVLYENTTLDFSLSDDTEKNRNLLKEAKFGTDVYNTDYAKFNDEVVQV